MKKVLLSVVLLLVTSFAFAQEKAVKDAKKIANSTTPNFEEAEKLINGALTNPETRDLPDTWDVAGAIQERRAEEEEKKGWLQQPYDTLQFFTSTLLMSKYYMKCDELAQIPNEKGKIKNKYRKSNSAAILKGRVNLLNGGAQFYNMYLGNRDSTYAQKALDFFTTYVDIAANPMFKEENLFQTDSILPQGIFYTCLVANELKDYPTVVKYASYGKEDKEYGMGNMELISTAYKAMGDTVKWVASLQEGIQKYPSDAFFFGNLIDYYSSNNKYDEAMNFADNMLAKDPENVFNLFVKGYLYLNMKQYDNALEYYNKAIEAEKKISDPKMPQSARCYSDMGMIYSLQAQDYSEKATTDINDPQYQKDQVVLKEFYEKAKTCYEEARKLAPEQKDLWLNGLHRTYYNLKMEPELLEIEKLM